MRFVLNSCPNASGGPFATRPAELLLSCGVLSRVIFTWSFAWFCEASERGRFGKSFSRPGLKHTELEETVGRPKASGTVDIAVPQ